MMWFWKKKGADIEPERIDIGGESEPGDELNEYSGTWRAVKKYATEEITRLREANDATTADATRTAILRGKIAALKDVLAMPENKKRGLIAPQEE